MLSQLLQTFAQQFRTRYSDIHTLVSTATTFHVLISRGRPQRRAPCWARSWSPCLLSMVTLFCSGSTQVTTWQQFLTVYKRDGASRSFLPFKIYPSTLLVRHCTMVCNASRDSKPIKMLKGRSDCSGQNVMPFDWRSLRCGWHFQISMVSSLWR